MADTASVALWGAHATQFDARGLQNLSTHALVVVLFVVVTVRLYEGQLSLQGSTICRYYPNAPILEVVALRNSFAGIPHHITWFGQSTEHAEPLSTTVTHLSTLNAHNDVGRTYNVDIVIQDLAPNNGWWYLGCGECRKATVRVGEGYKCPRCNAIIMELRYKLLVLGKDIVGAHEDDAPVVKFVFFGDTGQELVGVSALSLTVNAPSVSGFIPPEITRLYGNQYKLRVSGSRGSLQRTSASFQVDAFFVLPATPPTTLATVMDDSLSKYSMPIHDAAASSSISAPAEHALLPAEAVSKKLPKPPSPPIIALLPVHAVPQETTPTTPPAGLTKSISHALPSAKRACPDDAPLPDQTGNEMRILPK